MKNYAVKLLKILLCLTVGIVVLHVFLSYVSIVVYNEQHGFIFELSNRFDMNDETSVPQWFTQALFLAISATAFLAAYMADKKGVRRLWLIIASVGLLMSIDDVATLHEFVLQTLHNTFFLDMAPTFVRNAWLILVPFVLMGLIWFFVKMLHLFPRRTTTLIMIGSMIFLAGAVFVDSLTNVVADEPFLRRSVMGGVEGALQLVGTIILLYAIVDYLERHHRKALAAARKQLKSTKD